MENVYEDFQKHQELFDFSNYPQNSKYFNNSNNLAVDKMKDETCSVPIKGFIGLKSKIYTLITEENYDSKKVTIKMLMMKI